LGRATSSKAIFAFKAPRKNFFQLNFEKAGDIKGERERGRASEFFTFTYWEDLLQIQCFKMFAKITINSFKQLKINPFFAISLWFENISNKSELNYFTRAFSSYG